MRSRPVRTGLLWSAGLAAALLLAGCSRDGQFQPLSMWNESRVKPYEPSLLNPDESTARPRMAGTVARGEPWPGDPVVSGRAGGKPVAKSPVPVTPQLLERGQGRYNIFCAPCHGRLGNGEGMIALRGFPHPPDYAIRRLRDAPIGHFYDVITNGYGVMYSYAARVPPKDRWAIAAYLRVLQASREEVPEEKHAAERERARETGIPPRGGFAPVDE